jgi:hypothetical protein
MSNESASAHRAGRRALTRQSPGDLLTDSSSRGSSSSGSGSFNNVSPGLVYNASPFVTITLPSAKSSTPANPRTLSSTDTIETPGDEACFVDFQEEGLGK